MATQLQQWVAQQNVYAADDRVACRDWVQRLGCGGWLRYCVPQSHGGALQQLDSRALVVLREILSWHSPLADFSFAMQGLGSGAITLAGTPEQQSHYLPAVAKGEKIAAFALSEEDVGSDVAGMKTSATPNAKGFVLNGSKTWISNGGIADFYVVFAKTDASAGSRGISALVADAPTAGMDDSQHLTVMSPHPLSQLHFNNCQLASSAMLVELHGGFKLAIRTLDIFKASVAAAAIGMARRALHEACTYAQKRHMFGQTLADFQMTQAKLGEMASFIDASALLTYRAAWMRDSMGSDSAKAGAYTQAAAMAKLSATENAQRVIDMALQMHGGQGVLVGNKIEALYRDISALRIYDGASEVQQLIVGKSVLKGMRI
ncbi:MAG: acyl-CoA dehydrogenase family protein [Limnohabitans sp.]|nr:acyl-CoA dehydrogenase family protein [Limnohabitans sp.]